MSLPFAPFRSTAAATGRGPSRGTALLAAALLSVAALPVANPGALEAQARDARLAAALTRPEIQRGMSHLDNARAVTAEFLVKIGGIHSPSGEEHERAHAVAEGMRAAGLTNVRVTESPNAIGIIPGRSNRPLIFISTLDDLATVAENQKAAGRPPYIDGNRVVGPGTNTSLTSAALIAAADAYLATGQTPAHTLVFAAVAQEETGLVGMKDLYEEFGHEVLGYVDVLGDGHSISYGALGIHWWRVEAKGPGGHTLSGGLPNLNQGIGRAVDRILSLPDARRTDDSRTRINISILESGSVYNHKPDAGWFSLDIRSLDAGTIESIEGDVRQILAGVEAELAVEAAAGRNASAESSGPTGKSLTRARPESRETAERNAGETSPVLPVTFEMVPFQLTPGGQIKGAEASELVLAAAAISRLLGYDPSLSNAGSSNMNVALGKGTRAIGLGGSRGGERGQPGEWADIDGMMRTATQVFLLSVLVGG